jgi:hypothetical protein
VAVAAMVALVVWQVCGQRIGPGFLALRSAMGIAWMCTAVVML